MLSVILEFDVVEGKSEEFIVCWTECTRVIYENFGSLGSRLHKDKDGKFIAYAQWPDFDTYEKESIWPADITVHRDRMRALLKSGKPKVLHLLDVEVDLLKSQQYK